MTKKGVLISKEKIQEYKSKKVDDICHTIDNNFFIYFTHKIPTNLSSSPNSKLFEYEILQKDDACFCIWSYVEIQYISNLSKLFESNWGNTDNLFDEAVLFLYFLFNDNVILTDYDFFYTKLIGAFQRILSITESENVSDFNLQFGYDVWKNFFIWLHKIEPSALYSFFLCRYYRKNYYTTEISQLEKDLFGDPPQLKMPALYFNSKFLNEDLMFEHIIVKQYIEHFNNKDQPEILLISIFPFIDLQLKYNTNNNKTNKKKELESYIKKIIKGRINQSSHVPEFVIKCYKNQVSKIYKKFKFSKYKDQINTLLNTGHQQNALAIERNKERSNQAFYQIIPKNDEQLLLYGLPYNVSLQSIQEYDIFNEKLLFNNFPLESKGNAQLDQQVQSIINSFKLNLQNTDNLKFLIIKESYYQNFFKYKDSTIFKYLLRKYSNPQVKIPFHENNSSCEINIFEVYQSIFNLGISLKLYHHPLTFFKFKQSLEDYIIYQKNNPISVVENKKETSIQQFNKSTSNINDSPQPNLQDNESALKPSKSAIISQSHENIRKSSINIKDSKQRKAKINLQKKPKPQKIENKEEDNDDDDDYGNDDDDDDDDDESNQKVEKSDDESQKNNKKEETPKKVTKSGKKKSKKLKAKKSVKNEETPDKNVQFDTKVPTIIHNSGSTFFNSNEKPKVDPLIFITQSDTPYLFIDSVSNFIIQQYEFFKSFFPHFVKADKFKVFDINYLKSKLQSDKKKVGKDETINNNNSSDDTIDLNQFNEMHIINIIKMALFGILNLDPKLNSIFKDTNLSAKHLLFLFIFCQLEKKNLEKISNKMSTILSHVEKMSELKVEILSKLYFYDKNRTIFDNFSEKEENDGKNENEKEKVPKNDQNKARKRKTPKSNKNDKNKDTEDTQSQQEENDKNKQKECIYLSFNPPPNHYLILSQFKQLLEDNE